MSQMARVLIPFRAAVLGLVALQLAAVPALASETWCDTDPPVLVQTPGGDVRIVFVVDSGPIQYLTQLLTPSVSTEVRSVQSGAATQVSVDVTVRPLLGMTFPVHSEIWSGPLRTGSLLSTRDGSAGTAMHHVFILDVP